MDEGLKKYDCLDTLSVAENKIRTPNKYILISFRIHLGMVYHLQIHCCFGSLKTTNNNSANQDHLWFEKQCDLDIDCFSEEH